MPRGWGIMFIVILIFTFLIQLFLKRIIIFLHMVQSNTNNFEIHLFDP